MCGHSGERWVERAPVDRYNHETTTYLKTTATTGTDAKNVTRTIMIKSLPTITKHEKTGLKQL